MQTTKSRKQRDQISFSHIRWKIKVNEVNIRALYIYRENKYRISLLSYNQAQIKLMNNPNDPKWEP